MTSRDDEDGPRTLPEVFARTAAAHGARVAIDVPPGVRRPRRRTLTYAELDRAAAATARGVAPFVARDSVVAILLPRTDPLLFAAELGVQRAGAAYVALDPTAPDDHLRFVVEDARAAALLTDAAGAARAAAFGLPRKRVIVVEELVDGSAPAPAAPPRAPEAGDLAYVVYTSGTTGRPKGVMLEHRGAVNLVASDVDAFGLGPDDRVVQGSSHAYDSSVEETWLAFAVGATVLVMDDHAVRAGPDVVAWLRDEGATVFCPPPTLLRATGCVDPQAELPRLRLLYVGGEALTQDLADRWALGRRLVNGYGPTECTVTVVRGDCVPGRPVAIGRPVPGHRAYVLDAGLDVVADGDVGELWLSGVGLARGYLGRPELDAERLPVHPRWGRLYRTGDLVRRREDGELECLGRVDAQVKIRGHRVELEDVDARLAALPGVRAAASRIQGAGADAILVAHVVAADPARPPSPEVLRDLLRASAPAPLVPSRIALLDVLPTSTGGKLLRAALPEIAAPAAVAAFAAEPAEAVDDEVVRVIAEAIGTALGLPRAAGADEDFFDALGGDSLRAALVVSALRASAATRGLSVRDVYEARTARALAARARAAGRVVASADATASDASGRPVALGLAQAAWICGEVAIVSACAALIVREVAPRAFAAFGAPTTVAAAFVLAGLGAPLLAVASVLRAAALKRLLIGRYRSGRFAAWGGFHLRHWIVTRAARAVPWSLIRGTEFQSVALRAFGARIGRRVHLHDGVDVARGGWDLLEIGDDATAAQDAALRTVELDRGAFVVGPVTLGAGARLDVRAGVRPGAIVGRDAEVGPLACVGLGERVADGARWEGVPAAPAGRATPPTTPPVGSRAWSSWSYARRLVAARLAIFLARVGLPTWAVALLAAPDDGAILRWLARPTFDAATAAAAAAWIAVDALLITATGAVLCRLVGRIRPGAVPRYGATRLIAEVKADLVAAACARLSGTRFWPAWLRFAGMRLGRKAEVSTILDAAPELVTTGDDCFFADGIYLPAARLDRGGATFAATTFGARAFVGNHATIPAGTTLPDDVLLGVATVPDPARLSPGSSWFGNPPMALPRREVVVVDRRLSHEPGLLRRVERTFWEMLRFALPIAPTAAAVAFAAAVAAPEAGLLRATLLVAPAAAVAASASLVAVAIAVKWMLLGRVRAGHHGLWSSWCARWDFVYSSWDAWAQAIVAALEGTPLLAACLRATGCRIGRRVLLCGGFSHVVDPDMFVVGDGATVVGHVQAHSFEDRVLKIEPVVLGAASTTGEDSVLFYGADVGAGASVLPHSVVMKRERLEAGVAYEGSPARPATVASAASSAAAGLAA